MSKTETSLALLDEKIAALDAFAEENNLTTLTHGAGAFAAAINVANAIDQLKAMLSKEVMAPIMKLQGSSLGFRTDKDQAGGYPEEVVREAFIEATLRGFKPVGNEMNILAGRAYYTKEGFEGSLIRLSRKGLISDYRDDYSIPKIVSENEAVVTASASWKCNGVVGKIENAQFSIKVNRGMGADGIIGKAKRKLKARVYERVTGIAATEGDANDAIETTATRIASGSAAEQTTVESLSDEQKQLLTEALEPHAEKVNAFLVKQNAIKEGGTYLDVSGKLATRILGKTKDFLKAAGVES